MPSAGVTTSYSTVAVVPEIPKTARVTNAATGLYTVPADKKAMIEGRMILEVVGADATYAIAKKIGAVYFPIGEMVVAGKESKTNGKVILLAGEILTNIGDSGSTNATCDMDAIVQEITA